MELTSYAIPAILALIAKAIIYFYARSSQLRNLQTRLYLLFLFSLSIQNLIEITSFTARAENLPSPPGGIIYFATGIIAISILLHLVLVLALDWHTRNKKRLFILLLYLPAIGLEILLLSSPLLVAGFEPMNYTYTKVPGPLYFLFEAYVIIYAIGIIALLTYGSIKQNVPYKRLKNKIMLLGLSPLALLIILIVALQHFAGFRLFNTTATLPIALTFFLIVTAYATHQYRMFDIEFYIPWSKIRKRKTAFYNRIRAMISEIVDLKSVKEVAERLADTLRCPVAILGSNKPVLALAGGSPFMAEFPKVQLRKFDHIIVANEIVDSLPDLYASMKSHGVAAIVPFYPHSQHASGWLLLGDSFSKQVYTPLDFRMVEQLFDKMADLFLDKLLTIRTQLASAHIQTRALEAQRLDMQTQLTLLQSEMGALRQHNTQLLKEQLADSISHDHTKTGTVAGMITLVGRDKIMLKTLRNYFPQTAQFVGPDSSSFKRQTMPDVLICRLDKHSSSMQKKLLSLITMHRGKTAVLIYGPEADKFILGNNRILVGSLVELLSENISDEALTRKIKSLIQLRKYTYAIPYMDYPLIGQSQVFTSMMTETHRVAGFMETVLIKSQDMEEAVTLAAYIHKLGGRSGRFNVLRSVGLTVADVEEQFTTLPDDSHAGTLMVDNFLALPQESRNNLLATASKHNTRLIAGCDTSVVPSTEVPFGINHVFMLEIPGLRERKIDIPLLVHYFTLQLFLFLEKLYWRD